MMSSNSTASSRPLTTYLPDLPLVVWMILGALVLAIAGGSPEADLIRVFQDDWGRALGEFALILLPSFALAAALSRSQLVSAEFVTTGIAPVSGAGMVCPDTAYAALSPIAGRRKLQVAFGSYAGFKLLFPAGPLLVAIGLGIDNVSISRIFFYGIALLVPVWAIGLWWANGRTSSSSTEPVAASAPESRESLLWVFAPFIALAVLLAFGELFDQRLSGLLDFMTQPKGALWCAATIALAQAPHDTRRACIDSAVSRTAPLLFLIGAASALGAVLTSVIPIAELVPAGSGLSALVGLFLLTAVFKIIQGSSMATFAAVTPIAAPIVLASGLSPVAGIFAICLGSFVALLPNDSFYWLVKRDALADTSDSEAIRTLVTGSILQAGCGFFILTLLVLADSI